MESKIIKQENIGYLKTKVMLMQGVLTLSETHLKLEARRTGVSGFGILGFLLKKKVESEISLKAQKAGCMYLQMMVEF